MAQEKNPFPYGQEVSPGQLVDRQEEVEETVRTIMNGGKLFLVGPRRFGKTSILHAAETEATRQGAIVIRHDVEAYPGLDHFVRAIVTSAARKLTGPIKQVGQRITQAFARLRPKLSQDPVTQAWTLGLDVATDMSAPQTPLLVDALEGLAALADEIKQPVGLMLDEFQRVIQLGGESAEGQIRAVIQRHANVGYVFAGSKTTLLNDMTLNPARPFYRLGSRRFLRIIPRDQFVPAIQEGFASTGIKAPESVVLQMFDAAQDVPYNVQALANTAWQQLRLRDRQTLTSTVIKAALKEIVLRDDPFYTGVWNQCTVNQQRTLLAVIHEGGHALQTRAIAKKYDVTPQSIGHSLQALEARDVLRREEVIGDVFWRLEDPFFAVWLNEIMPAR